MRTPAHWADGLRRSGFGRGICSRRFAAGDGRVRRPKAALIYENERSYFFISQNDSARKVELKKGFEDAEKVEVLNDIPLGSQVIVLGQNALKDGSRVKVINEKKYAWQNGKPDEISSMPPTAAFSRN